MLVTQYLLTLLMLLRILLTLLSLLRVLSLVMLLNLLLFHYCCLYSIFLLYSFWGARWLSGRVSDSRARGRGFETYRRRVVSLSKTLYSPKVLVNYPGSGGSVWKIVDWDVKPQHKQKTLLILLRTLLTLLTLFSLLTLPIFLYQHYHIYLIYAYY